MKTDKNKKTADGQLRNGVFEQYFKDGSLLAVGEYKNGEKVVVWKYYLRKGLLKAIGRYADGKRVKRPTACASAVSVKEREKGTL